MKKAKILFTALMLMLACAATGLRAEEMPAGASPLTAEEMTAVDKIQMEDMDVEAMYWAWRVDTNKDATYEDLRDKSDNWIMKPETRDILFDKIKEILDSGKSRELTEEENKKYEDGLTRIRAILSQGSPAPEAEATAEFSAKDCVPLAARYWAGEKLAGKKNIDRLMKENGISKASRKKITAEMAKITKAEYKPLTGGELENLDNCRPILGD